MNGYLYHGSNTALLPGQYLEPRISFDLKPLVYATDDYAYALVRCGKFDAKDCALKEDYTGKSCVFTLVELRKNAFKDIFDTSGYIYFVSESEFTNKGIEFVSEDKALIIDRSYVPNVWDEMQKIQKYKSPYKLVEYKDCDAYFEESGIDKEKYLQRRNKRAMQLCNMREDK